MHHIQPQVCGGHTVAGNLATLCDNCHYTIHSIMHTMKLNNGEIPKIGNRKQRAIAATGYHLCKLAGTVDKIPNEG